MRTLFALLLSLSLFGCNRFPVEGAPDGGADGGGVRADDGGADGGRSLDGEAAPDMDCRCTPFGHPVDPACMNPCP